MVYSVY